MKLIWILLTFAAGMGLPIQAALNGKLGKSLESPLHASMLSFLVGMVGVYAYLLATQQSVNWAGIKSAPLSSWIGGLLGAFYVSVVILAFPKIGPALTFGLVVAGQMLMSLSMDHFQWLVSLQHSVNGWRILGVLLILAGVLLIRKF